MISKQLFISFLFLCSVLVPLHAFKQDILGVGIPFLFGNGASRNNSLEEAEFFSVTADDSTVTMPTTNCALPSPDDDVPHHVEEEEEEEVPHGAAGHFEPSDDDASNERVVRNTGNAGQDGNIGHVLDRQISGSADDSNVLSESKENIIPQPKKREEVPRNFYKEAQEIAVIARQLVLNNPRCVITGTTSIIVVHSGYSWWQRYRTHYHINNVLKKYGKNISTISPIQTVLMLAAYNKDLNAIHQYIAQYGIEPLQGADNAWVMPALEALCNR
jgi:hypothetical protein